MNIFGIRTDPDPDGLPADAPRGGRAERILAGLLLQELRAMRATMTEFTARLGGQIVNDILEVSTVTVDSTGTVPRNYGVAAGAIEVTAGGHPVTVSSAGPTTQVPTVGTGVYVVPANTTRVVGLASRQVTLYSQAGDTISFQVFTAAPRPVAV